MSLDNHRNLNLAFSGNHHFLTVAEGVAAEMNAWAQSLFGHPIIQNWREQLGFTTRIYRARGLHLDDRHVRQADGNGFSASIVDAALYATNNLANFQRTGSTLVFYLPKIQTAAEAALWDRILGALEGVLGLGTGSIKVYVLVEQIEASFQLMEIRAALATRFIGFKHGAVGLHQQRLRCPGRGPRVHQCEYRRDHHDLRIHARLRGSGAPGGEHAR